jgi:hypothetical protein
MYLFTDIYARAIGRRSFRNSTFLKASGLR